MRPRFSQRFLEAYAGLGDDAAEHVRKALVLLASDAHRPELQVKKMHGADGFWEACASLSPRLTFQMEGDTILPRNLGEHDTALARPSGGGRIHRLHRLTQRRTDGLVRWT